MKLDDSIMKSRKKLAKYLFHEGLPFGINKAFEVMAKPKYGLKVNYKKTYKGTSIGKKPITSTMNKNKRKGRTKKQIRRSRKRSK